MLILKRNRDYDHPEDFVPFNGLGTSSQAILGGLYHHYVRI